MSSLELNTARKKLAQRSQEASEKARRKLEKERLLEERKKNREAAIEKDIQERRQLLERREQALAQEKERMQEMNHGVVYWGELQAVPAPESIASDKGIKRAADKALLPASVGRSLLEQQASRNGAYFFEITNSLGRKTCAGLLEFSSAEGFIALPPKVGRCLMGPDGDVDELGLVKVVYRRLPKGTRAVFQPRSAEFQSKIGDDIRDVLENCLLQHSCLTVGDWVTVKHEGEDFDLQVKELEPEFSVSVIDTEMEAEVHPSVETEEKILQEELEARRLMEEREKAKREEEEFLAKQHKERIEYMARHAESVREKKESLPDAPCHDSESNTILILFRFPNGEKHTRLFRSSDPISHVFHFVDAMGANSLMPGSYRLTSQFPRHVIESSSTQCLCDIDYFSAGGRCMLFLEPISDEERNTSADVATDVMT